MVIRKRHILACLASVFAIQSAPAQNLVQVYRDALKNDPTFKEAQATWLTTKQNLPIAEAALFPTFDITAGVSRNTINQAPIPAVYFNSNNYGISITEQVFNYANWMQISGAKSQVKSATATYMAAIQDLMGRTSTAYFNVLKAASELRFTIAQKNAIWQQYITSEQKYKVGLIAITPVYDAQASYDTAIAREIADRNAVDNALEQLRAITGKLYTHLAALKDQVPLYIPQPKNIDKWTKIALKQNWTIVAQKYELLYQMRTIQQTSAARYPTVDASASWAATNFNHEGPFAGKTGNQAGTIGLSLNLPFYQGGLVSANTKQQEYVYLNDSAQLLFDKRQVVSQTRQAYLGVLAGISGVKADRQSVISNQNSLRATKAGYAVGTRTMVDLLQALSQLYNAQRVYAQDQYNYILNLISLKQNAGTLAAKDLAKINTWLKLNLKLIRKNFKNSYTPNNPPPDLKVQGQPMDLGPPGNEPSALPGGPRKGDMPRTNNDTAKRNTKQHYTVQVYASNNRSSAQAFIVANNLVGKAKIVRSHAKNQAAYKVVMGEYQSFAKANRARHQLPKTLQKSRPWVTHISSQDHSAASRPIKAAMVKRDVTKTKKALVAKTHAMKPAKPLKHKANSSNKKSVVATKSSSQTMTPAAKPVTAQHKAKPTMAAAESNELRLPTPS